MQRFIPAFILLAALSGAGCSLHQTKLAWRVKDIVLAQTLVVRLQTPDERAVLTLPTKTLQQLMLAHLRIGRTAKIHTELMIVEGEEANAFAGVEAGQRVIGLNIGMMKLIGDDINEYAALLGHEAAHWAKGHVEASELRGNTLNALGTLVGAGLGMAGVPAGGMIAGLGVDLIDATYSREQEREADALSIDYMLTNGYDGRGAISLHEKLLKVDRGFRLPFLSSHPSGVERVENLRKLIDAKSSPNRPAAGGAESPNQR